MSLKFGVKAVAAMALAVLLAACGEGSDTMLPTHDPDAILPGDPMPTETPGVVVGELTPGGAQGGIPADDEALAAQPTVPAELLLGSAINAANAGQIAEVRRIDTALESSADLAWAQSGLLALASSSGPYVVNPLAAEPAIVSLQAIVSPAGVVRFSNDSRWLAVEPVEQDDTVEIWDISNPNAPSLDRLAEINAQLDGTRSVAFSPDDNLLATGSADGTVTVWNTNTWAEVVVFDPTPTLLEQEILTEENAPQPAYAVAFSPNGRELAVETIGAVVVFNGQSGEVDRVYNPMGLFAGPVASAHWFPAFDRLAWISRATVVVLDAESQEEVTRIDLEDFISAFEVSPDGAIIATAASQQVDGDLQPVVQLWDAETGEELATYPFDNLVTAMTFSPEGRGLAVASGPEVVILGAP